MSGVRLGGYLDSIVAAGVPEADARPVEELMRLETGGVLDHLDKRRFNRIARTALATLRHLDEHEPDVAAFYRTGELGEPFPGYSENVAAGLPADGDI